MALWIIFAGLTIVVLVLVLFPFLRPIKTDTDDRKFESAVYRDQLQELERDAERGLISKKEKESALNEVSRRLLSVTTRANKNAAGNNSTIKIGNILAMLSVVAIAGGSGLLYKKLGRPDLPDVSQEQRIADASKNKDMSALLLQVQKFLDKNPKDIRGWKVVAPALKRAQRYQEAADAYAQIMQLDKPTPPVLVDYAESLLLANEGIPNDRVRQALKAALAIDSNFTKARFYNAMVLQQDGNYNMALKQWRLLLTQNPKNIEMQMAVQRQIASLKTTMAGESAKGPALDKDQREAAAGMTPKERQAMIRSMVQRLAGRLKENGNDLKGWQRLIRARMILGDKQAAVQALETARSNFKDNKEALVKLTELSSSLGL